MINSLCMCNIGRFADCESCTRPISANSGSMEAGEYGLTRGTCFVARGLEVVAVAGLLWISWRVSSAAGFFCVFFSPDFERTRPAASMSPRKALFTFLIEIKRQHKSGDPITSSPLSGLTYSSSAWLLFRAVLQALGSREVQQKLLYEYCREGPS